MAIGVYCDNCKHKELIHKFDKWPCMDCCDGDRRDPFTNADRIRSMTDEELAEWICEVQDGESLQRENYLPSLSKGFWLKWLKQESTNEST